MNPKIVTKPEMVRMIAKEARITGKAAAVAIDMFYNILRDTVESEKAFLIPGVGTVSGHYRAPMVCKDPRNGKIIMSREKLVVKITSSVKLKRKSPPK